MLFQVRFDNLKSLMVTSASVFRLFIHHLMNKDRYCKRNELIKYNYLLSFY